MMQTLMQTPRTSSCVSVRQAPCFSTVCPLPRHRPAALEQASQQCHGHGVLEHLYQRPIVSVADIQALLGTSYPAASNVVNRLASLGILREIIGYRRNRLFRYESYIQLFSETQADPVPPAPSSSFAAAQTSALNPTQIRSS